MRRDKQFDYFLSVVLFLLLGSQIVSSKPFSYYHSIEERNLFKPLWTIIRDKPDKDKRKAQLEERKLKAKIKQLKARLKLTGIIFNGQSYQAIIKDRRGKEEKLFYEEGDVIQEATVKKIDEDKLEVILDYKGKEIILSLLSGYKEVKDATTSHQSEEIHSDKTVSKAAPLTSLSREPSITTEKKQQEKRRQLIRRLLPLRGYLGIDVQPITSILAERLNLPFKKGLYIVRVKENTQASQKGLKRGDLILKIDGQEVRNINDVQKVFKKVKVDGGLSLTIVEKGTDIQKTVIFELTE